MLKTSEPNLISTPRSNLDLLELIHSVYQDIIQSFFRKYHSSAFVKGDNDIFICFIVHATENNISWDFFLTVIKEIWCLLKPFHRFFCSLVAKFDVWA